ncbi:MAG: hypothetical protein QXL18_05055 [Candidatus Woesearchaeota archaeon]
MKQLVNNNLIYYTGKYIMPILGSIFNICTLLMFYRKTYFFFFHFNTLKVYKDLLSSYKSTVDLNNWRGHKIYLWHDIKTISIHNEKECVISYFYSSLWDKNLNHQVYYLLS